MRIRNISIEGLFDTFDHEIPLFQHEPITIIHGPNGVGKTSILKLISGCLTPSPALLRSVPFKKLSLTFDDESTLEVTTKTVASEQVASRAAPRNQRPRQNLHFGLKGRDGTNRYYVHAGSKPVNPGRIEHLLPMLRRVGTDEWLDRRTDEVLQFDDVMQRYGYDLPDEFLVDNEPPSWLREIQQSTPVHFIETQRLLRIRPATVRRSEREVTAVNQCAKELAGRINER